MLRFITGTFYLVFSSSSSSSLFWDHDYLFTFWRTICNYKTVPIAGTDLEGETKVSLKFEKCPIYLGFLQIYLV